MDTPYRITELHAPYLALRHSWNGLSLRAALARGVAARKVVQRPFLQRTASSRYRSYHVVWRAEPDHVALEINGATTLYCTIEQMEQLLDQRIGIVSGWFPEAHTEISSSRRLNLSQHYSNLVKIRAASNSYRSLVTQLKELHQAWLLLAQQDLTPERQRAQKLDILRHEQAILQKIAPLQRQTYGLLSEQRELLRWTRQRAVVRRE